MPGGDDGGESEQLLRVLEREEAATKIQAAQRGRAARSKLDERLARKGSRVGAAERAGGALELHLKGIGFGPEPARKFAEGLVDEGFDTVDQFAALTIEELREDFGFKRGHLRLVAAWKASPRIPGEQHEQEDGDVDLAGELIEEVNGLTGLDMPAVGAAKRAAGLVLFSDSESSKGGGVQKIRTEPESGRTMLGMSVFTATKLVVETVAAGFFLFNSIASCSTMIEAMQGCVGGMEECVVTMIPGEDLTSCGLSVENNPEYTQWADSCRPRAQAIMIPVVVPSAGSLLLTMSFMFMCVGRIVKRVQGIASTRNVGEEKLRSQDAGARGGGKIEIVHDELERLKVKDTGFETLVFIMAIMLFAWNIQPRLLQKAGLGCGGSFCPNDFDPDLTSITKNVRCDESSVFITGFSNCTQLWSAEKMTECSSAGAGMWGCCVPVDMFFPCAGLPTCTLDVCDVKSVAIDSFRNMYFFNAVEDVWDLAELLLSLLVLKDGLSSVWSSAHDRTAKVTAAGIIISFFIALVLGLLLLLPEDADTAVSWDAVTDGCLDAPCGAHGRCMDLRDTDDTTATAAFRCICENGWAGATCLEELACASSPCQAGGGECEDQVDGSFVCVCNQGFTGELCDQTGGLDCPTLALPNGQILGRCTNDGFTRTAGGSCSFLGCDDGYVMTKLAPAHTHPDFTPVTTWGDPRAPSVLPELLTVYCQADGSWHPDPDGVDHPAGLGVPGAGSRPFAEIDIFCAPKICEPLHFRVDGLCNGQACSCTNDRHCHEYESSSSLYVPNTRRSYGGGGTFGDGSQVPFAKTPGANSNFEMFTPTRRIDATPSSVCTGVTGTICDYECRSDLPDDYYPHDVQVCTPHEAFTIHITSSIQDLGWMFRTPSVPAGEEHLATWGDESQVDRAPVCIQGSGYCPGDCIENGCTALLTGYSSFVPLCTCDPACAPSGLVEIMPGVEECSGSCADAQSSGGTCYDCVHGVAAACPSDCTCSARCAEGEDQMMACPGGCANNMCMDCLLGQPFFCPEPCHCDACARALEIGNRNGEAPSPTGSTCVPTTSTMTIHPQVHPGSGLALYASIAAVCFGSYPSSCNSGGDYHCLSRRCGPSPQDPSTNVCLPACPDHSVQTQCDADAACRWDSVTADPPQCVLGETYANTCATLEEDACVSVGCLWAGTASEPCIAFPEVAVSYVAATLTLSGTVAELVGGEGSNERVSFEVRFRTDVAATLSDSTHTVTSRQIRIVSVGSGSVVVQFRVVADADGTLVSETAVQQAFSSVVVLPTLQVSTVGSAQDVSKSDTVAPEEEPVPQEGSASGDTPQGMCLNGAPEMACPEQIILCNSHEDCSELGPDDDSNCHNCYCWVDDHGQPETSIFLFDMPYSEFFWAEPCPSLPPSLPAGTCFTGIPEMMCPDGMPAVGCSNHADCRSALPQFSDEVYCWIDDHGEPEGSVFLMETPYSAFFWAEPCP